METSLEIERIKQQLKELGTRPVRSFGQNFLLDRTVSQKIADFIPKEYLKSIVEIGPGLGILTEALLKRGAKITAIEKDLLLADRLEEKIKDLAGTSFDMIRGDATDILPTLLDREERDIYLVSNLPFNISSRLTGLLLDRISFDNSKKNPFKGSVIMFQEEFANRLTAYHGSKKYGRITVMFRSKMEYHHLLDVPKISFYPQPKVNASVIEFHPRKIHDIIPLNEDLFSKLVHIVFLNRRKKMKNSVNPRSLGLDHSMEEIRWILDDLDLSDRRPEELSPDIFITLSNRISELL